jgi:hypothetical protein
MSDKSKSGNPYLKTEWLTHFIEKERQRMIERHERTMAFFAKIEKDPNYKTGQITIPIRNPDKFELDENTRPNGTIIEPKDSV